MNTVTFSHSQGFYLEVYECFCTWRGLLCNFQLCTAFQGVSASNFSSVLVRNVKGPSINYLLCCWCCHWPDWSPCWSQEGGKLLKLQAFFSSRPAFRLSLNAAFCISAQNTFRAYCLFANQTKIKSHFCLDLWCPGQKTAHVFRHKWPQVARGLWFSL